MISHFIQGLVLTELPTLNIIKNRTFFKCNFQTSYASITAIDCHYLHEINNVDEPVNLFYKTLNEVINGCTHQQWSIKKNTRLTGVVHVNVYQDIKKAKYHRAYKASKTPEDYKLFSQVKALSKGEDKNSIQKLQN